MFVKNSNFVIYLALAALVGFGASVLFFTSDFQSSLLSGDISKASVYNNQKEDPEFTALKERLQNDEEFFNATESAYDLIKGRVNDLEELTAQTLDLCSDIPEFQVAIKSVLSLNAKAYNAGQYVAAAQNGLHNIAAGKNAPNYEQASNNTRVAFSKIENQLAIGKAFVVTATNYLEDKDGEEYNELAGLVAKWAVYCTEDAILNGDEEEYAYWNGETGRMSATSANLSQALAEIKISPSFFSEAQSDIEFSFHENDFVGFFEN